MECNSYIHHFLPDEITIIDADFECLKRTHGANFQKSRNDLFSVIDRMGQLSARAQGLSGAITTGSKLMYSDHRLYMLKDTTPSSRQVIGILKVGTKNLFIYDMHGLQHEMSPLCVLDFYVHESRQRQGCGRKLFDFMLAKEDVIPRHLAIDRPSHKFLAFLEKHYSLQHAIPQMYKFVVFQGFFRDRQDAHKGKRTSNGRLDSASKGHRNPISSHNQQLQQQLQQQQQQLLMQQQKEQQQQQLLVQQKHHKEKQLQQKEQQQQLLLRQQQHQEQQQQQSQIACANVPRSHRQSPPKHAVPASAHVHLNGTSANLVSNLKSLSIREGSAAGPRPAGDQLAAPDPGKVSTGPGQLALNSHQDHCIRNGHLPGGSESNKPRLTSFSRYQVVNRRDAQSAPVGAAAAAAAAAAAGPLQRDVTSWTVASVASGYTYEKGLSRNQRHTRLW